MSIFLFPGEPVDPAGRCWFCVKGITLGAAVVPPKRALEKKP